MLLRTLTGKYTGQIRDYDHVAGQAALRAGVAERLDTPARPAARISEPRPPRPNQNWDLIEWVSRSKGQPKFLAAGA